MATTAQLTTIISNKLRVKILNETTWTDVVTAAQALSASDKTAIVDAAKTNDAATIGKIVLRGIQTQAQSSADTEAANMIVDNTLDFTELDRILS